MQNQGEFSNVLNLLKGEITEEKSGDKIKDKIVGLNNFLKHCRSKVY